MDRKLSDRRIYPSFDLIRSGTRKEELLLDKKVLARMWILRKLLNDMNVIEAMEFIQDRMRRTKTNDEFMETMSQYIVYYIIIFLMRIFFFYEI